MIHPLLDKLHLQTITREQNFSVGDTVRVHYKIIEGNKERIQIFEGLVIAVQNQGAGRTFTVRRVSYDVGVERIFPLYSPNIAQIEKVRSARIRRAKLYFIRDKVGKDGRLKELKKKPARDSMFARAESYRSELAKAAPAPVVEAEPAAETETAEA